MKNQYIKEKINIVSVNLLLIGTIFCSVLIFFVFSGDAFGVTSEDPHFPKSPEEQSLKTIGEYSKGSFTEKTEWKAGEEAVVRLEVPSRGMEGKNTPDIMLVMDYSGSMSWRWNGMYDYDPDSPVKWHVAQEAMHRFIDNAIPVYDRIGFVIYNHGANTLRGLFPCSSVHKSFSSVRHSIDILEDPNGSTSIGAGLRNANRELIVHGRGGQQCPDIENSPWYVILATDGLQNTSPSVFEPGWTIHDETVLEKSVNNNITVYTIAIGNEALGGGDDFKCCPDPDPSGGDCFSYCPPGIDTGEKYMREIANQTGGKFFHAATAGQMISIYEDISEEIHEDWLVSIKDTLSSPYFSDLRIVDVTDADGNSKNHDLEVSGQTVSGDLGVLSNDELRYVYIKAKVNPGAGSGPWAVFVDDDAKENLFEYYHSETGDKMDEIPIGNVEVTISPTVNVFGHAWLDQDCDGVQDAGEAKVSDPSIVSLRDLFEDLDPTGFSVYRHPAQAIEDRIYVESSYCWCPTRYNICPDPVQTTDPRDGSSCSGLSYQIDMAGEYYGGWYDYPPDNMWYAYFGLQELDIALAPQNIVKTVPADVTGSQAINISDNRCFDSSGSACFAADDPVVLSVSGHEFVAGLDAWIEIPSPKDPSNPSHIFPGAGQNYFRLHYDTTGLSSGEYLLTVTATWPACGKSATATLRLKVEGVPVADSWFQSEAGDVFALNNVSETLPDDTALPFRPDLRFADLAAEYNYLSMPFSSPGLVLSGLHINLGPDGKISERDWNTTSYSLAFYHAGTQEYDYNFNFFETNYEVPSTCETSGTFMRDGKVGSLSFATCPIIKVDGDLVVENDSGFAGIEGALFVTGSVVFKDNFEPSSGPSSGFYAFIANGDIEVGSGVENVRASLIANKSLQDHLTGDTAADWENQKRGLWVQGSTAAFGYKGGMLDGISYNLKRTRIGDDIADNEDDDLEAADYFSFDSQALVELEDVLGLHRYTWQEIE